MKIMVKPLSDEPRCARCGRTTAESDGKTLSLRSVGFLCYTCLAKYESGEWPVDPDHEVERAAERGEQGW